MENLDSSAPKPKSVAGWIFSGLSFVFLIGGVKFGWVTLGLLSFAPFSLGVAFAIVTIFIGVVKKSKGQIFIGIALILFAVFLYNLGLIQKIGRFPTLTQTSKIDAETSH